MSNTLSPSARAYVDKCHEFAIHVNKHLRDMLNADESDVVAIDVSQTMIGSKGFIALNEVLYKLPNLRSLNVATNNISSESVIEAIEAWKSHPRLQEIILDGNHIPMAGQALYEFVKKSSRIRKLSITGTAIRPMFVNLINLWIRKNNGEVDAKINPEEGSGVKNSGGGAAFTFGDAVEQEAAAAENNNNNNNNGVTETAEDAGRRLTVRQNAVSSEIITDNDLQNFTPRVVQKSDADRSWLFNAVETMPVFAHLEDTELFVVVDAMMESIMPSGEPLPSSTDTFYLIRDGTVEATDAKGQSEILTEGCAIEERCLMHDATPDKRYTPVNGNARLYKLDREHYRLIVAQSSKRKRAQYISFLQGISFLKNMSERGLLSLADALKSCQFKDGEKMISYAEEGTWFYLIREGTVVVIGRDENNNEKEVTTFTVGACVGELEFINGHKCVADVVARGPVRAAKMHRSHFEMVMGPVKELLKEVAEKDEVYEYYRRTQSTRKSM
eukprot:PhM_4_TR5693/c1_g1_i1/m.18282/K04739/PRKAR; cAMP-dependent protein kinase regulator